MHTAHTQLHKYIHTYINKYTRLTQRTYSNHTHTQNTHLHTQCTPALQGACIVKKCSGLGLDLLNLDRWVSVCVCVGLVCDTVCYVNDMHVTHMFYLIWWPFAFGAYANVLFLYVNSLRFGENQTNQKKFYESTKHTHLFFLTSCSNGGDSDFEFTWPVWLDMCTRS